MNATAFNGGKVHLLTELAARCGVCKHAKRSQWQTELGEVTCRRCIKLGMDDGQKEASTTENGLSDKRRLA